MTFIYK